MGIDKKRLKAEAILMYLPAKYILRYEQGKKIPEVYLLV